MTAGTVFQEAPLPPTLRFRALRRIASRRNGIGRDRLRTMAEVSKARLHGFTSCGKRLDCHFWQKACG